MIREDDYLDTLISLNVSEHIEDDRAALERFRQALKPSGRLILSFLAQFAVEVHPHARR